MKKEGGLEGESMGVLSTTTESLPLGFRFRPTDEELINHYLRLKINGRHQEVQVIPEVDVCKWEPWDLPQLSVIKTDDPEWFFFCPRDRKYPNGHRSNRATDAGYWKATGKDRTIKSHRSSPSTNSSNSHLIGMKKTLVFYRGRAPKGERTNWIMHEYRATAPDLDGTASGQAAYVLCRLFHKPDEKADSSKYEEADPSASSPNTVKSSPDDTSSDLFQEPSVLDMPVCKQPAGIETWLTDKSDDATSNGLLHVESCTSDVEDHLTEAGIREVYPTVGGNPMCNESTDGFNCKIFSPLMSHNHTDIGCPSSPFADDFGSNQNGMHFQDGTSEQDVSLTELLDVLLKHDVYPSYETTSEKFLDVGSRSLLPDQLHERPAGNYNPGDWGVFGEADEEMVLEEVRTFPEFLQSPAPSHDAVCRIGNDVGTFHDHYADPVSLDGNHREGTGIKIHKRQASNRPYSENLVKQGTAARRIRLQKDSAPIPNCDGKYGKATSFGNEEQDEDSVITEDDEYAGTSCTSNEPEIGSSRSDSGLRARELKAGVGEEKDKVKGKKFLLRLWADISGTGSVTVYGVSMYGVIILFILTVGLWKCPYFSALQV